MKMIVCVLVILTLAVGAAAQEAVNNHVLLSDDEALDIVVAFLQQYDEFDKAAYYQAKWHRIEESWYGNTQVYCDFSSSQEQRLDNITFELDPVSGDIIRYELYDRLTRIHYVNTVPENTPVSAEEARRIAETWMKNNGLTELSDDDGGLYYSKPSGKYVTQEPIWLVNFSYDLEWYRVAISSLTGDIWFAKHYHASFINEGSQYDWVKMNSLIQPVNSTTAVFEVVRDGKTVGTTEAYETDNSGNPYLIIPLLKLMDALEMDVNWEHMYFSCNGTAYMLDAKYDDVAPLRQYTKTGLLDCHMETDGPLFRETFAGELYADAYSIQYFARKSLGIQIEIDYGNRIIYASAAVQE
ncbi:MAG: hypothetical protein IKP40_04460 [Clostridia bacterium]|nr:hypothetical protein [Clostridia bacterium]